MIWKIALGVVLVTAALFLKFLTEEFNVNHDSWLTILIGVAYYFFAVAMVGAIRFLRRTPSH